MGFWFWQKAFSSLFLVLLFRISEGEFKFTLRPSDPSYAGNGTDAKLVWDYVDNQADLLGIVYSVKYPSGSFTQMLSKSSNGNVTDFQTIPAAYKGRVWVEGRATLVIGNVSPRDNTLFQCTLRATDGHDETSIVELIVKVAPQISISSVQPSYSEGSVVNITCMASGTPDPDVKWLRNGTMKSKGKEAASLTFNNVSRTDDGQYKCQANNSAGDIENNVRLVVNYPPTIKQVTASSDKSWIGQKVTLTCESDGVPTPTLTWYKPDGNQINSDTDTQHTVDVKMNVNGDFGTYKCVAGNGLIPADLKTVEIKQIIEPGSPTIKSSLDIQATSLSIKWNAPAGDGGSPITAYRVVILKSSMEIKNVNVTDSGITSLSVGDLERDTEYTVKVLARNAVFEGPAAERKVTTKYEGVPSAATIGELPKELNDDTITLTWSEPQNNGKEITNYTVYQRIMTDGKPGDWIKLKTITDVSVRDFTVELEKGKVYEFVVTAANKLGESLKEDGKIMRVKASKEEPGDGGDDGTQTGEDDNGMGAAIYAGAAAAGVLLIIGIIVIIVLWRRRKPSSDEDTSRDELGSANHYESEEGYHSVSREAAQSLQASGAAAEPDYAQVDQSRKKKNRMPANDEYAQVDKSKKTKKKKKKKNPGELEYADLADLRSDIQLGPVPAGGAAAAAPIVRPPAYEGTVYADISQFGVPQPDPTYANVPKQEVVYSNVESM